MSAQSIVTPIERRDVRRNHLVLSAAERTVAEVHARRLVDSLHEVRPQAHRPENRRHRAALRRGTNPRIRIDQPAPRILILDPLDTRHSSAMVIDPTRVPVVLICPRMQSANESAARGALADQLALVSGAARGVGLACARRLAELGAHVVLSDIDSAAGAQAAEALCAHGARATFVPLDVSDVAAIRACVSSIATAYGHLDVLVNNAGICPIAEIEDVTEQQWDRTLQVNLKGTFFLSQAVVRLMKAQHRGRIINVASVAARSGGTLPLAPYAASKAGIVSLTKTFASHLAPFGVNVNAVAPGPVDTDLTRAWTDEQRERARRGIPWGRFATADEVAAVVAFLAGPGSEYMTGTTVDVNGGLRMD
jgi:NAD(P)-dependent dehydrogenase (short-subunit alcohol dehydrogenase family)